MWESEFHHNVSAEIKMQDFILDQTKLKVKDTYRKYENKTMNFEHSNIADVINKGFLDKSYLK